MGSSEPGGISASQLPARVDAAVEGAIGRSRPLIARMTARPWVLHAVGLAVNFVVLFSAGRSQWFFFDEWDPIANRVGWADVLQPHGEHPFIIPGLSYRLLLGIFGLHTYIPYLLVVIVAQLVLTHLLWRLAIRVGVVPIVATAVAFVFGMLGAGYENLLWAFQMSLVGSAACGIGALLLSDHDGPMRRADWGAVGLGTLAWMFSGVGLTAVLVVALAAALRRRWSAAVLLAAIPLGTYLVWSARYARDALDSDTPLLESVRNSALYAVNGFSRAFGDIVGLEIAGPTIVALVAIGLVVRLGPRVGDRAPAVAGFAGGLLFLFLAGVRRSSLGLEQAEAARYIHLVLAFSFTAIALAIDGLLRSRPQLVPASLISLLLVAGIQVGLLAEQSEAWAERSDEIREYILAAGSKIQDGEMVIDQNQVYPQWAPDLEVGELRRIVDGGWLPDDEGAAGDGLDLTNAMQVAILPTDQDLVSPADGGVGLLGLNGARSVPIGGGCQRVEPEQSSATIAFGAMPIGAIELRSEVPRNISVQTAADSGLAPISVAKTLFVPEGSSDLVLTSEGGVAVLTLLDTEPIDLCGLLPV